MRPVSFKISPRVAMLSIAIVIAPFLTMLTGCAAELERRPDTAAVVGNQARSWELVFASPTTVAYHDQLDPRALPEYARADARLNARPNTPLLASNQWPEPDRPSLRYPRRVWIDTRPESILFFESRSEVFRGGAYPYDGHRGHGAWGFW